MESKIKLQISSSLWVTFTIYEFFLASECFYWLPSHYKTCQIYKFIVIYLQIKDNSDTLLDDQPSLNHKS